MTDKPGYYYEHTSGGIHWKPFVVVDSVGAETYFESPFVKRWWKVDEPSGPDFLYLECPECEYSTVISAGSQKRFCGMCAGDNGRDVRMKARPATDADQPEGADARKAVQAS